MESPSKENLAQPWVRNTKKFSSLPQKPIETIQIFVGFGWRLGFLGLLHMEVFSQRLEDEYEAEVIITTPSVPYKVITK